MSSDGNSGKSKGGVWLSLRRIFGGGGKPDEAPESEQEVATDEQSVEEESAEAAPADDAAPDAHPADNEREDGDEIAGDEGAASVVGSRSVAAARGVRDGPQGRSLCVQTVSSDAS